jgi:signal transduction histidine kinase
MRTSLKTKITLLTVAVTTTIIVALFTVQVNNVTDSWVAGTLAIAQLAGQQVKHVLIIRLEERAPQRGGKAPDWPQLLRSDRSVGSLLESTMAQAPAIIEISIGGQNSGILVSSDPSRTGNAMLSYPELQQLQRLNPIRRLFRVLEGSRYYELRIPLGVANEPQPIFTVQVLVSPVLLREELLPAIRRVAEWGAGALLASVILASLSARLLASNLSQISVALDRITSGQSTDAPERGPSASPEFAAIESKLDILGHQFRGTAELRGAVEKVLDELQEAVLLFNSEGRLTLAGGAVQRVIGTASNQLVGLHIDDIFPPNDPGTAALAGAFRMKRELKDEPFAWTRTGTGARLLANLEFNGDPRRGNLYTVLLRIRNAAGQTNLESELGTAARLDAISRITSSVAHEIKNPLNAIAVRLDNLHSLAGSNFPEAEEEIQLISEEVNRLDRVVRTFLDFTRPVELVMADVDAVALAREISILIAPDATRRSISIRFSANRPRILVRGDQDVMREAIINVITNGIEAMPQGGTLELEVVAQDSICVITVSDTGPGIPNDARERIFHLYFTTKKNGTGLGLPMAYRALQLHGGAIDVENRPGMGASFVLKFPMMEAGAVRTSA